MAEPKKITTQKVTGAPASKPASAPPSVAASAAQAPQPAAAPASSKMALELFSIAGSLNSTLDLDFLLQKIGAAAEQLLNSEANAIMLVTDDKKHLFFKVASGGAGSVLKTMKLPIGQGIAGWVAQHLKPEVVNDTRSDKRFAGQFDKASGFITRSLLCVPMLFRGELVGVVEVLNKRSGVYTREDIGLLSSLANLASVAITNTKLIQEQKNFFSHVLELLVGVIESSKPNMEGHPMRSARLSCAIGKALEVEDYVYRMLYYAGLLHDIGYVAFKNPRVLAETGIVRAAEEHHPILSVKILEGIKMLEGAIPMIQHHHERFDGGGYPGKLKGDAIPIGARILGLVEALEELRMLGLRGAELAEKAIQEAKAGSGGRFDPAVVEAAVELLQNPDGIW
ncbi:MAG: GAF domain-containing protein [Elusimicrobia bacterium]|nr:GAF domain-containing protein [Elusimicrobiota bacterium]